MGAADGEDDERPPRRACVDEFAIGIFPVTNAPCAQFERERSHSAPPVRVLPLMGRMLSRIRSLAAAYFWTDAAPPAGHDCHPVTLVEFEDTVECCACNEWPSAVRRRPFAVRR